MYPLIVLTLNHIFGLVNESAMLFGCFGFFMIYYVIFVFVTVDQIKRRLGIRAIADGLGECTNGGDGARVSSGSTGCLDIAGDAGRR